MVTEKFTDFSGTVTFNSAHPERSRAEATISVKSIDTGVAARDHHLLAADFSAAEKISNHRFQDFEGKLLEGLAAATRVRE